MTPKRIQYAKHALRRMREREISRADVRWLLAQGLRVERPGPERMKRGALGKREAAVLYLESATAIYVITVMWLD